MNKYHNGKIYKITDIGYNKCYIGSTCDSLSQRMARHRCKYKKYLNDKADCTRSFLLFDEYGVVNCKIELIEEYRCENKSELLRREGHHIQNTDCINKQIAGRPRDKWVEDNKGHLQDYKHKWYMEHMEEAKERAKKYKEENKEHCIKKSKEHHENHREEILQKHKEYYQSNKERLSEKAKEKIICCCGSSVGQYDIRRHERTKKHIEFKNNQK